jgi:ABC-type transporter MlaC component
VSGIWLVQQLRSTFVGTISRANGNIDELFKYLKS